MGQSGGNAGSLRLRRGEKLRLGLPEKEGQKTSKEVDFGPIFPRFWPKNAVFGAFCLCKSFGCVCVMYFI
jgi:hypothetical protein